MDKNDKKLKKEQQSVSQEPIISQEPVVSQAETISEPARETTKKKRRLRRILFTVPILLLLLAAVCTLMLSIFPFNAVKNSFDALLFDSDEASGLLAFSNSKGYDLDMDIQIPAELVGDGEEYLIDAEVTVGRKGKQGSAAVTLGHGEDEFEVVLCYDEDVFAVGGFKEASETYFSFPRRNVVQKLEGSAFHPDSNTFYSLNEADYQTLKYALISLDPGFNGDSDTEITQKLYEAMARYFKKMVKPDTQIGFSSETSGPLRTVKYEIDGPLFREYMGKIEEEARALGREEEATNFANISSAVSQKARFEFSYTLAWGKIYRAYAFFENESAEGQIYYVSCEMDFDYSKENLGFDICLNYKMKLSGQDVEVTSDIQYSKLETGDINNISFLVETGTAYLGQTVEQTMEIDIAYNEKDKTYTAKWGHSNKDTRLTLEGKFEVSFSERKLLLTADKLKDGMKTIGTDLVRISIGEQTRDVISCPSDSQSVLSMRPGKLRSNIRSISFKPILPLAGDQAAMCFTVDGYLLDNQSVMHDRAKKYAELYAEDVENGYISSPEGLKLVPNRISIYESELDVYILLTFNSQTGFIEYAFTYGLSTEQSTLFYASHVKMSSAGASGIEYGGGHRPAEAS